MKRSKGLRSRHRAIGPPTQEEQAAQDAQRAHGCAMCRLLGFSFRGLQEGMSPCGPTRVHHRTTGDLHGQKQLGQGATVALGDWHHQGILMVDRRSFHLRFLSRDEMQDRYGPSLAHHKRAFVDLLADLLGERSTAALQAWQDEQIRKETAA